MRTYLLISTIFVISLSRIPIFYSHPSEFMPNTTYDPTQFSNSSSPVWDSYKNLTGCHLGDQAEGLDKLKQYFHKFGYIPDTPSNFTDEFDDSFESALKSYQINFNLNPTGILDESTMQQIQRPRCGVADIINGSSTMNSGKEGHDSKLHTVAHFNFFPGKPSWPNRQLSYAFDPDSQLTDSFKSVISRAFQRWSEVTPLTFKETKYYYIADLKIGMYTGDHGDGEPFDGVLGTLAHAFSPTNGRFHLDGSETWIVEGDVSKSSSSSAIDLESIAVHEIGHLLGLGHSSVEESIMYPTISSRRKKVDLTSDDVEGIQSLYGSNPNYNGSTTLTARDTSSNGIHPLNILWWVHGTLIVTIILVFTL